MPFLSKLVDAPVLYNAIKSNKSNLRVLDCTFSIKPRSIEEFESNKFYGQFQKQAKEDLNFKESFNQFLNCHIPNAQYFNLPMATHPTDTEKLAYYPPEIFEQYPQLLGLNSTDHLELYSNGPFSGMLFASRVYWHFKAYGHSGGLSILNGGINAWLQYKLPVVNVHNEVKPIFPEQKGNWKAKEKLANPSSSYIKFEEIFTDEDKISGQNILIDTRPRAQFKGFEFGLDPSKAIPPGTHLPGSINIPAIEMIDENEELINSHELHSILEENGLCIEEMKKKQIVSLCNSGMQASLFATALDVHLDLDKNVKVYGGSLLEIQAKAPELINEGEWSN